MGTSHGIQILSGYSPERAAPVEQRATRGMMGSHDMDERGSAGKDEPVYTGASTCTPRHGLSKGIMSPSSYVHS